MDTNLSFVTLNKRNNNLYSIFSKCRECYIKLPGIKLSIPNTIHFINSTERTERKHYSF